MIVADASCLVAALHGQEPSVQAVTTGQPVAAPHLVDAEVLRALRGLTIAGKLSAADAAPMVTAWEALSLRRFPLTGLVRRMWEREAQPHELRRGIRGACRGSRLRVGDPGCPVGRRTGHPRAGARRPSRSLAAVSPTP